MSSRFGVFSDGAMWYNPYQLSDEEIQALKTLAARGPKRGPSRAPCQGALVAVGLAEAVKRLAHFRWAPLLDHLDHIAGCYLCAANAKQKAPQPLWKDGPHV